MTPNTSTQQKTFFNVITKSPSHHYGNPPENTRSFNLVDPAHYPIISEQNKLAPTQGALISGDPFPQHFKEAHNLSRIFIPYHNLPFIENIQAVNPSPQALINPEMNHLEMVFSSLKNGGNEAIEEQ